MTTIRTISQARARMMQSQQPQAPPKTLIRYTREELLSLREASLDTTTREPEQERDQLFSVENLLKFANKPVIQPVEPKVVLPQSPERVQEKSETHTPAATTIPVQTHTAKTTKSYLSLAKSAARNSPQLASKLRSLIGDDQPATNGANHRQSSNEHTFNIPIVIDAGPMGQFKLNACAKLSIKINLDMEGLRKSRDFADPDEKRAFIRQQIHLDTSDCQFTIQ